MACISNLTRSSVFRRLRFESLEERRYLAAFEGLGFLPTGTSSSASAISGDGRTIVGGSQGSAFVWTRDTGMIRLGHLPGGASSSRATAVSDNGLVVVGTSPNAAGDQGFVWTVDDGMRPLNALLAEYGLALPNWYSSYVTGVSADGKAITGYGASSSGPEAFRLSPDSLIGLGDLPGGFTASYGNAISSDGSTVVGYSSTSFGNAQFRWTEGSGMQNLVPAGKSGNRATAVSADGSVVVGNTPTEFAGGHAFRWTDETGSQLLTTTELQPWSSYAFAVSADGAVVAGQMNTTASSAVEAFVWTEGTGYVRISDALERSGINLHGWHLTTASGISADGRIVVGTGRNPAGSSEAWRAELTLQPDIDVVDATTRDLRNIDIEYEIESDDVDEFKFKIFLSADGVNQLGEAIHTESVSNESDRKKTENEPHRLTIKLDAAANIQPTARYILVVADADEEIDESDEDNNTIFVIPLFGKGVAGGFSGNQFAFGGTESSRAGASNGRVSRGMQDFARLLDGNVSAAWEQIGGTFANDPAPYQSGGVNDGSLVQHEVEPRFGQLASLLAEARNSERFDSSVMILTEAFDEEGDHANSSTHYEGRGIDIQVDQPENGSSKLRREAQERLTGLAFLAGFDWVQNELQSNGRTHLHASVKGRSAELTLDELRAAVEWGATVASPKLIANSLVYDGLNAKLLAIQTMLQNPLDRNARRQIAILFSEFQELVRSGTASGEIRQGFASTSRGGGLLISNAALMSSLYRLRQPSGSSSVALDDELRATVATRDVVALPPALREYSATSTRGKYVASQFTVSNPDGSDELLLAVIRSNSILGKCDEAVHSDFEESEVQRGPADDNLSLSRASETAVEKRLIGSDIPL